MKESDNVVPQKMFSSITSVPLISSVVNANMMIVASDNNLYQVNSTGGSTIWGSGGTGGGAADGVNIVSMGTSTFGGGTGGTTYSNSTGTIGIHAGSNITLSQSNDAIIIHGPSPAAASVRISAGGSSSNVTGITFTNSNNVSFSFDNTNILARAGFGVSGGASSVNATAMAFSNANSVSFGLSTAGSGATVTASIPTQSLSFADSNGISFGSTGTPGSTTITARVRSFLLSISGNTTGTVNIFTSGTVVLAGGNNITLSQSSNTITIVGGAGGGGGAGAAISAGTAIGPTSGTIIFTNSNNVSFGVYSSSRLSASIPAFSLVFDNTGAGNVTFGTSTAGSTTYVTASAAGGTGGGVTPAFSAAGGSSTFNTLRFLDTNGISFTNSGGSLGGYRVNLSMTATGNTTADTTGTQHHSNLHISGAGAASVGFSAGTAIISVGTQTNQAGGIYAVGNTTGGSSSSTYDARSLSVAGSNMASVGWSNGSVVVDAALNLSAGTQSSKLSAVTFSNSNGVSFGLNAGTVTATLAQYSLAFNSSNGVSFGTATAGSTTTVTASHWINLSAGTTSNNLSAVTFSNANNIRFGLNASTVTADLQYLSSYENSPIGGTGAVVLANGASVSAAAAFFLPHPGSFSVLRLPVSIRNQSTSRTVTASSMNASVQHYSTWNAVIYSMNTGASSKSLTWVASGNAMWTHIWSLSMAADGTSGSYSNRLTGRVMGADQFQTADYTVANANSIQFFSTAGQTNYSGIRYLDIDFATSLSAGNYWMVVGYSSSSATNSTQVSAATLANPIYFGFLCNSQANQPIGEMGSTNMSTNGLGAGSFSTAGGGTTAAFPISAISSNSSNARIYFQMVRSA